MTGREFTLETRLGRFAGLEWRKPGNPRLLCLHGWLDNAASFQALGSELDGFDVVALDLAGHGHSMHRPNGARYHMVDNLWDLDAVLDALAWERCALAGHSLGGVIATTYAAADPGRVSHLVALDGLGPLTASAGDTVPRLRASLESVRRPSAGLRDFASHEEAAAARSRVSGWPAPLSMTLVRRALTRHADVYRWHTDPALNWRSPILLSEEQALALLAAIEAPVLAVIASSLNRWVSPETIESRTRAVRNLVQRRIDGHHHFHMDQAPAVAAWISGFISDNGTEAA